MPCHIPSASVSSRRRRHLPYPSSLPPTPLALLDLSRRTERAAHDYLTRATTHRDGSLRLLDLRRAGPRLLCAVIWRHNKLPSLLEINLADDTGLSLRFTPCATEEAARAELQQRSAEERVSKS